MGSKFTDELINRVEDLFYRERKPDEKRVDNSTTAIAKAVGRAEWSVNNIIRIVFKRRLENPPTDLHNYRNCDCYRHRELCQCKIK